MAATEPVTWRLTDHACRVCFGRVLERRTSDGRRLVRCANCGTEVEGRVENLCCCGLKTKAGRLAGMKCVRNDAPTPEQPSEVMVRFEGVV